MVLDIDELQLAVEAATTADRAPLLLRKVSEAAERLPAALESLGDALRLDDEREIFIEELTVHCSVASHWDLDGIARAFARSVQQSIAASTPTRLVFRDRAEYVAAYLIARTDGVAGRRWWFDGFSGLEPLSLSNALRTIVLDEGEIGVAALARLLPNDAVRVLAAFHPADATRVLDSLATRLCPQPPAGLLWSASARLLEVEADPSAWIATLIAAERRVPGSAAGSSLALLRTFRALRVRARRDPPAASAMAMDARQALVAWSMAGGLDPSWVATLDDAELAILAVDLADLAALAALADGADVANRVAPERAAASGAERFTRFGGAFVLAVVLERLGWIATWRTASGSALEEGQRAALAWLVVVKAAAPNDALTELLEDPTVQLLAAPQVPWDVREALAALRVSLPQHPDPEPADGGGDALEVATELAALELLGAFGDRVPGCTGASPDYLRANLLACTARVRADRDTLRVDLGRPPLDVLLVLSGWKRSACTLPDGRRLVLGEGGG